MKTKILIAALLIACTFSACKDEKAEEKKTMDDVIKIHDKVMGKSEMIVQYKATLDSLTKVTTDSVMMVKAVNLKKDLTTADAAMEDWMHKFNPDFTGKSHTDVMVYLQDQQVQIKRVDSLITNAIDKTGKYLKAK
jgi:putative SOS response-associated peptidase YedK